MADHYGDAEVIFVSWLAPEKYMYKLADTFSGPIPICTTRRSDYFLRNKILRV